MQLYTVTVEDEGKRLREILRGRMQISYSAMKSAKWNGEIRVNGARSTVDVRVRPGERIEVLMPERQPVFIPEAFEIPLEIPYEDEWMMIVDKPAPLASQSSRSRPGNSLENAVYSYLGQPEGFIYRPVNRLDKGTSGLMVIAKDGHSQDLLQRELHTADFRREYVAMTAGIPEPEEGVIDLPIGKADGATVRREIRQDGKPARTHYRVTEKRPDGRAMVRLRLETGRTHQIRVHLAAIGCPVCGDFLYGTEMPEEFPGRFALHSAYVRVRHPMTGAFIEMESAPKWT